MGIAALGIVGIAVTLTVLATSRGGGADDAGIAAAMKKAGCTYKVYTATSQAHINNQNQKVKYNSVPPSNGKHYFQPAPFGNYSDPVPQVVAVHNLEHGAMLIEWGSKVSRAIRNQIDAFYGESPNGMLVFPYPVLGKRIAFVAWTADVGKLSGDRTKGYHGEGRVALCTRFDETAAKAFQKAFRAKGPERFPLDALKPGQ
jgi:hypothetical protein